MYKKICPRLEKNIIFDRMDLTKGNFFSIFSFRVLSDMKENLKIREHTEALQRVLSGGSVAKTRGIN